jgi:putative DNA primase/helicase
MTDFPDFKSYCRDACIKAWGQPDRVTKKELRWGTDTYNHRSFNVAKGLWYDAGSQRGGSTLELVAFEKGEPSTPLTGARFFDAWQYAHKQGWIPDPPAERHDKREPNATYDYEDANGCLRFQVCRYEPGFDGEKKSFRQRQPDSNGGWIDNVKGIEPTPYRLPQLLEAIGLHPVFVCEGEKDCNNLVKLGLIATTNAMGAGKWRPALNKHFRGGDVIIIQDSDPQSVDKKIGEPLFHDDGRPVLPGQDHAQHVAASLHGIAARVRLLDLKEFWPEMPVKGDISDWLDAGHTIEELWDIVDQLPDWKPIATGNGHDQAPPWQETKEKRESPRALGPEALMTMTFDPIKYVVPGIIVEGLTLLAGKPKLGKS